MDSITSNVIISQTQEEFEKTSYPTPFENIMTLYHQIKKMHEKKKPLIEQLNLLTDSSYNYTEKDVDEMEKLEEEINFINGYSKTLESQLVVIMNEHDVKDIPPLLLN